MSVEWKSIVGFDKYLVSTDGAVMNKRTGRLLKLKVTYDGYYEVRLYSKTYDKCVRVHRLVAKAFIPNPDKLETVDHINGNKLDNRVENLRWLSRRDNVRRFWVEQATEVQKERMIKKKPVKCLENGVVYESITKAAEELGLNRSSITGHLSGRRQYIHGLHFEFVKECAV